MPQLVGQRGYITWLALIIDQDPGSDVRSYGGTESAAHLSSPHIAIQVVLFEHPACQGGYPGLKLLECIKHHISGFVKIVLFLRFNYWSINIIPPQALHLTPARF